MNKIEGQGRGFISPDDTPISGHQIGRYSKSAELPHKIQGDASHTVSTDSTIVPPRIKESILKNFLHAISFGRWYSDYHKAIQAQKVSDSIDVWLAAEKLRFKDKNVLMEQMKYIIKKYSNMLLTLSDLSELNDDDHKYNSILEFTTAIDNFRGRLGTLDEAAKQQVYHDFKILILSIGNDNKNPELLGIGEDCINLDHLLLLLKGIGSKKLEMLTSQSEIDSNAED